MTGPNPPVWPPPGGRKPLGRPVSAAVAIPTTATASVNASLILPLFMVFPPVTRVGRLGGVARPPRRGYQEPAADRTWSLLFFLRCDRTPSWDATRLLAGPTSS